MIFFNKFWRFFNKIIWSFWFKNFLYYKFNDFAKFLEKFANFLVSQFGKKIPAPMFLGCALRLPPTPHQKNSCFANFQISKENAFSGFGPASDDYTLITLTNFFVHHEFYLSC